MAKHRLILTLPPLILALATATAQGRAVPGEPPWPGSLVLDIDPSQGLETRLVLGEGESRLILDLSAQGSGAKIEAGFEAPGFLLGPANLGGLPAFLHNPVSESASGLAPAPFDLDGSLSSGLSALGLGLGGRLGGPFSLVVLAREASLKGLAFLPGPGSEAGQGEASFPGREDLALGLLSSLGGGLGHPRLSLACLLVDGGVDEPEDAWKPGPGEPSHGETCLFGLSLAREGLHSRSLVEAALSLGPFRPAGRALRLEAHIKAGCLDLGLRAAAVSGCYAVLLPSSTAGALALGLDGKLDLGRGARLSLALRASAPSLDAASPPGPEALPDRAARLTLLIPSGVESLLLIEPRLELGLEDGLPILAGGLGLERSLGGIDLDLDLDWRPRLCPDAEGQERPARLGLALSASAPARLPLPAAPGLCLELCFEGEEAPRLGLDMKLGIPSPGPGGKGGLELRLGLGDLPLAVAGPGLSWAGAELGLSWKKDLAMPPKSTVTLHPPGAETILDTQARRGAPAREAGRGEADDTRAVVCGAGVP